MKKQKKIYLILLLVLVIVGAILLLRSVTKEAPKLESSTEKSVDTLTDQEIFNKVKSAVVAKGIKEYWTTTDCVTFEVSKQGEDRLLEVREKHYDNAECPGDKNTAPLSGMYKIDGKTGEVTQLSIYGSSDPAEYVSLDRYAIIYSFITDSKLGDALIARKIKNFDELSDYKDEIIDSVLYSDLNNDGKKEAALQLQIGANGAYLLILGETNDGVRELFGTDMRAGTMKIENSKLYQHSSIEGTGEQATTEISWNGKDWDMKSI